MSSNDPNAIASGTAIPLDKPLSQAPARDLMVFPLPPSMKVEVSLSFLSTAHVRLFRYKSDSPKMAGTLDGQKIVQIFFSGQKLIMPIVEIFFPRSIYLFNCTFWNNAGGGQNYFCNCFHPSPKLIQNVDSTVMYCNSTLVVDTTPLTTCSFLLF